MVFRPIESVANLILPVQHLLILLLACSLRSASFVSVHVNLKSIGTSGFGSGPFALFTGFGNGVLPDAVVRPTEFCP